jgi:hypothetical protein
MCFTVRLTKHNVTFGYLAIEMHPCTPPSVSQLIASPSLVRDSGRRHIAKWDSLVSRLETTIAYWQCTSTLNLDPHQLKQAETQKAAADAPGPADGAAPRWSRHL